MTSFQDAYNNILHDYNTYIQPSFLQDFYTSDDGDLDSFSWCNDLNKFGKLLYRSCFYINKLFMSKSTRLELLQFHLI